MAYDIGDAIELAIDFTDVDGNAANPTTVTCDVLLPDKTITSPTASGGSPTGHYTATLTITQSGRHYYRFAGTGALVVAEEGSFFVKKRKVPEPA